MGRVRVKICGITSRADALAAVEAGADAIGLVFAESPRQVSVSEAAHIVSAIPPWVTAVGVFVNAGREEIAATARKVHLGAVQFHGDELPCVVEDTVEELRVIKAFRIGDERDLGDALDYLGQCRPHACLVDSRSEAAYGGSGAKAPWDLVAGSRADLWPLILGGGLSPENVGEAIRIVQPFAVESSSGVEQAPGRKDPERVRAFIRAAASMEVNYPPMGDRA